MKAFLQYLLYLLTGRTTQQQQQQQQQSAPVLKSVANCELQSAPWRVDQKRRAALSYLGDKWLLHPANHVQRRA